MNIDFSLSIEELECILENAKKNVQSGEGDKNLLFQICDYGIFVEQKDIKHDDIFFENFRLHTDCSQLKVFEDIKSENLRIQDELQEEKKALREVAMKVAKIICPHEYYNVRKEFNGFNIRGIIEEGHIYNFETEEEMFKSADMSDCCSVLVEYQDKITGAWKPVQFITGSIDSENGFLIPCTASTAYGDVIAYGTFTDH